jgi:hypothetical protein
MWIDWSLLNKNEATKEDDIEEGKIIEPKQLNYIFIKIFTSTKPIDIEFNLHDRLCPIILVWYILEQFYKGF